MLCFETNVHQITHYYGINQNLCKIQFYNNSSTSFFEDESYYIIAKFLQDGGYWLYAIHYIQLQAYTLSHPLYHNPGTVMFTDYIIKQQKCVPEK